MPTQLTQRVLNRALDVELVEHLGYEKGDPAGRGPGNDRNGSTSKDGILDSTRAGGVTVVAVYSPRVRPGTAVSFPVAWDQLDRVAPADFTVRTAARLVTEADPWAGQRPDPQRLGSELIGEGRAIPVARVQAMHEGTRRARARRG